MDQMVTSGGVRNNVHHGSDSWIFPEVSAGHLGRFALYMSLQEVDIKW